MKQLVEILISNLERGDAIVLATVIGHKGSVPRNAGAKMVVCQNGTISGTIGGGSVESETIERAREILKTQKSEIVEFNMTNSGFTKGEMVCGGKLKTLIQYLNPERKELIKTFKNIIKAVNNREQAIVLTCIENVEGFPPQIFLVHGSSRKQFESEHFQKIDQKQISELKKPAILKFGNQQFWCEPLAIPTKLFLFGGGHVSRSIAAISHTVGFDTFVIDDRPEIIKPELFPAECTLQLISEFKNCFETLDINKNDFIVIITCSHVSDMQVLEQAVRLKALYIGLMGSRRKRLTIYNHLSKKGISQALLNKINSPIGLDINAETPAELSISILGELIQKRGEG
jgi:xanthine dehydrogenase accessory factor